MNYTDIISKHSKDFNITTENKYLKSHGGYEGYVKSLGDFFKSSYRKTYSSLTYDNFQKACDYVYTLLFIWGVDYDNGKKHCRWGNGSSDRYYTNSTEVKKKYYGGFSIDDMLSHKGGRPLNTNCNYMAQLVYGKLGIGTKFSTTNHKASYAKKVKAKLIYNKDELKAGDLIHFHDGDGKWHHVAIVGKVQNGIVTLYETGSRMITQKKKEFIFKCDGRRPLSDYDYGKKGYWVGIHFFDLTGYYSNKSDTDLAIETILCLHSKGNARKSDLGDRYDEVMKLINRLLLKENHLQLIDDICNWVLDGNAGKGNERKKVLSSYYTEVQKRLNDICTKAEDVWNGKYGKGDERRTKLGSDYYIVMKQVNRTKELHK